VNVVTGREEERGADKQDVLSEVNAHVHEAAKRFEGVEPSLDRWDFTCECGAAECRATASLTLAEYEELRAEGRPLLAPGHKRHA
jgi:predicted SprT family Zn-dependent metalloprotease